MKQPERPSTKKPQEGFLYGMDYLSFLWDENGADYLTGFRLLKNLGVRSIRHWMHFDAYMADWRTFKPAAVRKMHEILAEADRYSLQVIGMNHVNWSLKERKFCVGKPSRRQEDYTRWLEIYEENWYLAVREFPEILYWEIDNELNNKDFMFIQGRFGEKLPTGELAALSADLLLHASRGIHRANPQAITVMGGIVDPYGLGIPETDTGTTMVNFLEALYDAIESGRHGSTRPDDFFEVAAWHPYYYKSPPDEYFVEKNQEIYEVVCRREKKEKKVFLTEFGWDESLWDMRSIPAAIERLFAVVRERMPYVEALHYYRLFDDVTENHNTAGLFCDPVAQRRDVLPKTGECRIAGSPKPSAYAYQRAAGGQGPLDLFQAPRPSAATAEPVGGSGG
ncbi:MAG TPA: hypothetical protein H9684_07820 [Firmicutes bacterium]|nr:hypothetical protein [Bacillota bacterium]